MSESEHVTWDWFDPGEISIEWLLTTDAGRAVWSAASDADARIVRAAGLPDREEVWARDSARRRRAQMEVMLALFDLHAEMGVDAPETAGVVLAQIVADAATVAKLRFDWESRRGAISGRVRTRVYRRDGYACVECGADDVTQLTLDHRIPVALGGSDDPENLRTLCRPCNSRKGVRL